MKEYWLKNSKDDHGQPLRIFRFNADNNARKAVDQLSGICAGILADGVVTPREAEFFADWIRKTAPLEPVWPFTDLLARVNRIFADGQCDDEEREELKAVMKSICGDTTEASPGGPLSSSLPLDCPLPDPVIFSNQRFAITGKFAFGTRRRVIEAIETKGGMAIDTAPGRDCGYLVIGFFASRDWIHANYGRKIEHAVKLRESGSGISIISEEHWKKFIDC